MSKSKFPKRIEKMIISKYNRCWGSRRIADYINNSATAVNLNVSYSYRSIAAKIANLTR